MGKKKGRRKSKNLQWAFFFCVWCIALGPYAVCPNWWLSNRRQSRFSRDPKEVALFLWNFLIIFRNHIFVSGQKDRIRVFGDVLFLSTTYQRATKKIAGWIDTHHHHHRPAASAELWRHPCVDSRTPDEKRPRKKENLDRYRQTPRKEPENALPEHCQRLSIKVNSVK